MGSYAGKNKPVGIAQPFPKKEVVERPVDLAEGNSPELESLKAGLKCDSISSSFDKAKLEKGRKLSSKDHCGEAESDSGSDTMSSFDFPFEPPTSSDDAPSGRDDRVQPKKSSREEREG